MLYVLSACLMYDLAGDSVYQAEPDPVLPNEGGVDESSGGAEADQIEISDLEYSQSEGFTDIPSIFVEVFEDRIDVVHSNVELACDMSQYEPDIYMEDRTITVYYMPLGDDRDCFSDVHFSLDIELEEGTYTLQLMEDETEFVYE